MRRDVLEEFAEVAKLGGARHDIEASAGFDPESARKAYREKQERRGLCRSCTRPAKQGRRYCIEHLARANARARKSQANAARG